MGANRIDLAQLEAACSRLGDVALDPDVWPELLEQISAAVGAAGAILLQADARTPDVPRTALVRDVFADYFSDGWHLRDVIAQHAVPRLLGGEPIVTERDVLTLREIDRDPMFEMRRQHGFRGLTVVGFRAGSALWGMSFQLAADEPLFEPEDKRRLAPLSRKLTEAATLSTALGRTALGGATSALDSVKKAAIAVGRGGLVLDVNAGAAALFNDDLRVQDKYLFARDKNAQRCLDDLFQRPSFSREARAMTIAPIVVRRARNAPVVVHVLTVPLTARTPFLGARAILTFTVLEPKPGPNPDLLIRTFNLSPAEARLASVIADGSSPEEAAEKLGIARETARNQLKAVFAKTGTHRQGRLIALLARL